MELEIGQRVRIIIAPPGNSPVEGSIRVIQDVPGKKLGVELDNFVDYGHSLDGIVEERVDEARGIVVGKGYWTLPSNIEII